MVERFNAPWYEVDENNLERSLLDMFKIPSKGPELTISLKPYVLLLDEFYTELYQISAAQERMIRADKIVFMGTS